MGKDIWPIAAASEVYAEKESVYVPGRKEISEMEEDTSSDSNERPTEMLDLLESMDTEEIAIEVESAGSQDRKFV